MIISDERELRRFYDKEFGMTFGLNTTDSDIGSLRIGKGGFMVCVPNGRGDGETYFYVLDKEQAEKFAELRFEYLPGKKVHTFFTTIEGSFEIYDYDCGTPNIKRVVPAAKYNVYAFDGVVTFAEV